MEYLLSLIGHFLSSNSRHGTHSPFVYKLCAEVIYVASKGRVSELNKAEQLLTDISAYFNVSYTTSVIDDGVERALMQDESLVDLEHLAVYVSQFKYVVIPAIYKDRLRKDYWASICRDTRFVVCIDLFYFGLVFYRTEQSKERFKLRFPYWR